MSQEIRALTKLLWETVPKAHCFYALSFSWRASLEVLEEAREIKGSKSWPHSLHAGRMKGDGGMPEGKWGTRQKCRWKVGEEGVSGLMRERVLAAISSVQFSSVVQLYPTLRPDELQHARPPYPSPTPGVYQNPWPSSQWCHPSISSSVVPFSSCPQSLPASGSFPRSQLFEWGGQSIRVSASASVLPMKTQDWFPLEWTGWISLQSKGLSRVFSNTTVQNHQFFSTQLSSQSNSHIHTWPLEKP